MTHGLINTADIPAKLGQSSFTSECIPMAVTCGCAGLVLGVSVMLVVWCKCKRDYEKKIKQLEVDLEKQDKEPKGVDMTHVVEIQDKEPDPMKATLMKIKTELKEMMIHSKNNLMKRRKRRVR
ncbi:uncharacterized protein LOC129093725 [Anoplopoma fimbria]|uniref:uncharacterized protein LOC129093725 n=1 Tax=Anoplopoma fimbria TaxID=229290 RepID=UPI0023ED0BF8|nr:uncharacterized protein LOC129093725 [Anoplopoma fimbria]